MAKRYKLKKKLYLKEKEIMITLKDLEDMNKEVKKNNKIRGFIFGFEEIKD